MGDESLLHVTPSNIRLIISAIELDLREMVLTYLNGQLDEQAVLGKELWEKCIERQKQETGFVDKNLKDILPYADFADLYQILNSHRELLPRMVAQHIKAITPQLEKLVGARNRAAHNRPLYYDDCE